MQKTLNDTDLNVRLLLGSLKDSLSEFVAEERIQSAARSNDRLADVVEKARVLRNLAESTTREIVRNWHED